MEWKSPPPRLGKPLVRRVAGPVLGAMVGAILGIFLVPFFVPFLDDLSSAQRKVPAVIAIACLPLAWLIAVGLHELGHIVGGWLIGGRFLLWIAGPIKAVRTPSGIRWGWNRSFNTAGGVAACLPADCSRLTASHLIVMILGGPVASLLSAGVTASLVPMVPANGGAVAAWLEILLALTAVFSLLLAVATTAPFTAGGFKSDGRRAWDLCRGGPRRDQEIAMVILSMQLLGGTRPRDLDRDLLRRSLRLGDGSAFDLYARLNAYQHAADCGEWDEARLLLEAIVSGEASLVPLIAAATRCEYAWLLATRGSDPPLARAWLESAGPMDFDPATRLRAESAVLLAEGATEAAHAKAVAGLKALDGRTASPVRSPFATDEFERLLRASAPGVGHASG